MESKFGYSNLLTLRGTLSVLVGILIIVLPLAYDCLKTVLANEMTGCGVFLLFLMVVSVLLFQSTLRHCVVPFQRVRINIVDVFAILCLLYCAFNATIIDKCQLDRYMLYSWGAVITGYWLLRCGRITSRVLLCACCISGAVQSGLAVCQRQGWIPNNNALFDVTGSFNNPGQLGGYIAICCILSLGLLQHVIKVKNPAGVFFLVVAIFVQFYGLFLADSRASWVACILGAGGLFC